ncbi:hypothetical protein, partial [Halanaerobium sp. MA284_MarDTE_T2]|uniref:hypothetical protein n=1 Tax=Halanaerobium sp. MA284_MarDTE_T2 TaxID=2183913 RepID=UPI001F40FB0D
AGTGVKLASIFLAAIIASFMTEGMALIPCYLIVERLYFYFKKVIIIKLKLKKIIPANYYFFSYLSLYYVFIIIIMI